MSDNRLLKIYHRLPPRARSAVASLRGYYLNYSRYGPETEAKVIQALEREFWSIGELEEWQNGRLARLLERAATNVPYYRRQWESASLKNGNDWKTLQNWPVLRKNALRGNKAAFVGDDVNTRRLFLEHTSGTTGTPVEFWSDRATLQAWYALAEARWRRWYSVSRRDRWAIIGGQHVAPFNQEKPPFWVWNAGLNQLYMSALHIRPDFLSHYLDAIRRYKIVYLYGYSSSLYWLALAALDNNITLDLKVVLTNAEPLYDYQREAMQQAFNCPVRETYGLCEMVCAMSECEFGRMHLWTEAGVAELLDNNDQPVKPGEAGKLVCTGLLNEAMPLVRYEVMDEARFARPDYQCPCGRGLPVVEKILGRLDDAIVTKDGRKLALLDIVFGAHLHIKEAQIVQESLDLVRVRVVPAKDWSDADAREIRAAMVERMGQTEIRVEIVDEIERTFAGKLRVMVSKINSPHRPAR
ncbi:MAG: phenylacetate--CoA ligase family protein [Acidobacteria bacterium]|nr:phenylacetate--CoA ligase family protein [Acidobacteriota bacterium]